MRQTLDLQEKIEGLKRYYFDNVKPHFEKKDILKANRNMFSLYSEIKLYSVHIMAHPNGLSCISEADNLVEKILRGYNPSKEDFTRFETYLNRLMLPEINNN